MLTLIASGINLMPDRTLIIQLGIFLFVIATLQICIFGPVLRIIDKRKSATKDAQEEARRLTAESERIEKESGAALKAAILSSNAEAASKTSAVAKKAQELVAQSQSQAREKIEAAQVAAKKSEQESLFQANAEVMVVAKEISSRIESSSV